MQDSYDLVIIGAGPSALAAAIYTTREDISTLLIEKGLVGGLMATIDKIDNFPGFPKGIEGLTLAGDFQAQAERFGAQIDFGQVKQLEKSDHGYRILVDDDRIVQAKTVLVASGNDYRKIGIPGEKQFYGNGVHYCATCDGAFYRGKRLVVIGGANAAVQEAMFLTKFASHVDLIVRSHIKSTKILRKQLQKFVDDGKIALYEDQTPLRIIDHQGVVAAVETRQTSGDKIRRFDCDGVFIFAGVIPNTAFLKSSGVKLDKVGHILTDQHLMTNLAGVFASGDVRAGATKQVAAAAGEGVSAALSIREYLSTYQTGKV
jgi:thioredoxin reductase (NADPH)